MREPGVSRDDARVFVRGVDRPNISLLRWEVLPNERLGTIAQLCRIPIPGGGKVMIFVPTRKIGETLQGYLGDQGLNLLENLKPRVGPVGEGHPKSPPDQATSRNAIVGGID